MTDSRKLTWFDSAAVVCLGLEGIFAALHFPRWALVCVLVPGVVSVVLAYRVRRQRWKEPPCARDC